MWAPDGSKPVGISKRMVWGQECQNMMLWIIQHPVKIVTKLQPSSQDVAEEKGNPDSPDIPGCCSVLLHSLIWEQLSGPENHPSLNQGEEVRGSYSPGSKCFSLN